MNFREKIINAIYSQCVCDAVGNKFEFDQDINPKDVVEYANSTDKLVISDDSQLGPLFGFEAIHNLSAFSGTLSDKIRESFTYSYIDWYYTQTTTYNENVARDCLVSFKSMFSVQAPGYTCLSALNKLKDGKVVDNDSMGCGSVMRLLPMVKLFGEHDLDHVLKLAQITGNITHKHEANNGAIHDYMTAAYNIVRGEPLFVERVSHISELGEGWIAQECTDMGIYAYTQANTFDELLELSIAHSGDSDSVAAVAGSLWGLSGKEVPQKYIGKLDAIDAIKYVIENYT
jgi:ADP-ribosylglycohydrolase